MSPGKPPVDIGPISKDPEDGVLPPSIGGPSSEEDDPNDEGLLIAGLAVDAEPSNFISGLQTFDLGVDEDDDSSDSFFSGLFDDLLNGL